jgi:phospholipase/carboxylesterase
VNQSLNRRGFCTLATGAVTSLALGAACRRSWANLPSDGRIKARPKSGTGVPPVDHAQDARATPSPLGSSSVGRQIYLGLDRDRDAILQLPKSTNNRPLPLLMFLHGATQNADDMFWYLDSAPDEAGVAILAPNSRDTTWDAITDSFGPDVQFLNSALERVFDAVEIDPARIAIGGFSDGATYAIALGLINGDLFKHVLGCSPGFVVDGPTTGKPSFFISHGTRDNILPIDRCGRRIAADLKTRGYEVTFREFDGRHEIPKDVMLEALRWVAGAGAR